MFSFRRAVYCALYCAWDYAPGSAKYHLAQGIAWQLKKREASSKTANWGPTAKKKGFLGLFKKSEGISGSH
jgi:hypothetical protein